MKLNTHMQEVIFQIANSGDRLCFTSKGISIMADECSFADGKHHIAYPLSAQAQFSCCGTEYLVGNTEGIPTIEEWFLEELAPRREMLDLLLLSIID